MENMDTCFLDCEMKDNCFGVGISANSCELYKYNRNNEKYISNVNKTYYTKMLYMEPESQFSLYNIELKNGNGIISQSLCCGELSLL